MANKYPDEISLMKGISTKLDEDTVFTLGYFVHTEKGSRDKSEYLYVGRIDKIADLRAEAAELNTDAKKLKKWTWKGLPKYNSVVYDRDDTNARGSRWYTSRLQKIVSWEMFCKIVDGWQEFRGLYNKNASYATEDYITLDGNIKIDNIKTSRDLLLTLVGQSIIHENKPKLRCV